jgi:hypothetical protein
MSSFLDQYQTILDKTIEEIEEIAKRLGDAFAGGLHADPVNRKMRLIFVHSAGVFLVEQDGGLTDSLSFKQWKVTDKSQIPTAAWAEFAIGFQNCLATRKEFEQLRQTALTTVLTSFTPTT